MIPITLAKRESVVKKEYKIGELVWYEPYTGMAPPFFSPGKHQGGLGTIVRISKYDAQPGVTIAMFEIIAEHGESVFRSIDGIWKV